MKKLTVVLFIILFIFSGCNTQNIQVKSPKSKTETQVSPKIASKSEVSNTNITDSKITKAETPKLKSITSTVYDIKGSCEKPVKYPNAAMEKWRKDTSALAEKYPGNIFVNGYTNDKIAALTFDDGPAGTITPEILKILRENGVHATFFCIGTSVENHKDVVLQAYKDGNIIANHSWSHKDLSTLSAVGIDSEISSDQLEIYKVIGKKPAFVRPPYGSVNSTVINYLNSNKYKTIMWSIDTLDWAQKDPVNITSNVINNVRPGEIILMHCNEDKINTAKALPGIISKLKAMGYRLVGLDEMLNCSAYQ